MWSDDLSRRGFLERAQLYVSGLAFGIAAGRSWTECPAAYGSPFFNTNTDLFDRLFIMDTWFWKNNLSVAQQNELLHEVGVPRTSECRSDWVAFPKALERLDLDGIDLVSVYVPLDIDSGNLSPHVGDLMSRLKGRRTFVWIAFTSRKYKPSDQAGDDVALRLLRQAADLAQEAGLHISIYPHFSFWVERNEDALRLIRKAQRDNIGFTFNLYHWLKVEGPANLGAEAKDGMPSLNCITINGSRKNAFELNVEEGILPLGEGDYNVEEFLKTFVKLGYEGPIGLQGYGIGGDIRVKLRESLEKWRAYCSRIQEF